VLKEVPVGDGPDTALYVAAVKEVWVVNKTTNDITCVDAASLEVKATIKLEASPRGAIENRVTGQVFVGLVDADAIGVIDPRAWGTCTAPAKRAGSCSTRTRRSG